MRNSRRPTFLAALSLVMLGGAVAAPLHARAAWEGLQLEATAAIDVAQPAFELVLDVPASAFVFHPVEVKIDDNAKKQRKIVDMHLKVKNETDDDYFIYTTAILLDADGKPVATKSQKDKIEEDDPEGFGLKFKLSYAQIARVHSCKFQFAFEED